MVCIVFLSNGMGERIGKMEVGRGCFLNRSEQQIFEIKKIVPGENGFVGLA